MANENTDCGCKINKHGIHKIQDKTESALNVPIPLKYL